MELAVSEACSASECAVVGMRQASVQLRWFKSLTTFHCLSSLSEATVC